MRAGHDAHTKKHEIGQEWLCDGGDSRSQYVRRSEGLFRSACFQEETGSYNLQSCRVTNVLLRKYLFTDVQLFSVGECLETFKL